MEIYYGDNQKIIATDWKMSDFGESIMPYVLKMPKQDMIIYNYSQYTEKRYWTGCAVMGAINNFSTLNNKIFSQGEISSIYDLAEVKGWTPGSAWSRSEGYITMMQRWNAKYPNDKAMIFTDMWFSDTFNIYMEKLGIVGMSINVDTKYRKDVRDNLVLDGDWFALDGGHATTAMLNNKYFCVDSVSRNYTDKINEGMQYVWGYKTKIETLIKNKNIRKDVHVVIMERRLKEKDPVEVARLTGMKKALENAITTNSEIWALTTLDSEKALRHDQNENNRIKLRLVESMLS